ncbi:MAG: hypothetical protein M9942_14880 [Microthrixaceae bacterium]|nr:hypothetical protein [Microthrixaceae bacterium]
MEGPNSPAGYAGLLAVCVVLGLPLLLVGWGVWSVTSELSPDPIPLDPLDKIAYGLDVAAGPTEWCPESASTCWGAISLSSGETPEVTTARIKSNVELAGFATPPNYLGDWAPRRGCFYMKLYPGDTDKLPPLPVLPPDAMTVSLDYYCDD